MGKRTDILLIIYNNCRLNLLTRMTEVQCIVRGIPDTYTLLQRFVRTSLPQAEGLSKPQAFPVYP